MSDGPAFCTIIASNYLAFARVLAASLRRHHPGVPCYVGLVDDPDGRFDPAAEPFPVVPLGALGLPRPDDMCFRYDVLELCTAVKPFLLRRLIEKGHAHVVYLDPDVRVYGPLAPVFAALATAPLVLTPHLTEPAGDERERTMLRMGAYNLGFAGVAAGAETDRLLAWWAERCETRCLAEPDRGLFVDQKWMDLAPGLIEGARVLRDPGLNVAYWNLARRPLTGTAAEPRAAGAPLAFFHWSGFDPLRPALLSRHDGGATRTAGEPLAAMALEYSSELLEAGHQQSTGWAYGHARFRDGHPIDRALRRLYAEQPPGRFRDPFAAEPQNAFLRWALTPERGDLAPLAARLSGLWRGGSRLGRTRSWLREGLARVPGLAPLARGILSSRADLADAFSDARSADDRRRFLRWLASDGVTQAHLKPAWCAAWLNGASDGAAARCLIDAYDARPELASRFPAAFVAEHDAPAFREWLREHGAALAGEEQLGDWDRLFEDEPVAALRRIYDARPDVRDAFPDAFGWPGDPRFLAWLRDSGRREYGIPESWVVWLERARQQHVCVRLRALYAARPEWRERHPHAFGPLGRRAFLAWLRETEPELRDALAGVATLCVDAPAEDAAAAEELRSYWRSEPTLVARFPGAFEVPEDTRGLLGWTLAHTDELGLTSAWSAALERTLGRALRDRGVLVAGYLAAESGMGELARACLRSLAAIDHPCGGLDLEDAPQRKGALPHSISRDVGFPCVVVHANAPEALRLSKQLAPLLADRVAVGYWAWELESPPSDWEDACALFREVWTCSRHAAAAIGARATVPVHVLWPSIVDRVSDEPPPGDAKALGIEPDVCTFLFAFDYLSEIERKNPHGAVEAFRRAFRRDERVRLVIKTTNGALRPADRRALVDRADGLPVSVIDRYFSHAETLGLMAACDAYVSLHRAEGFGLTLAEAMGLGKPVIATHYSGPLDFMTPWNSYPVPYRLVEIAGAHGPYRAGAAWADPDLDAAAESLRRVYLDREAAAAVGNRAREDVRRQLAPAACGRRIAERLAVLTAGRARSNA